MLLLADGRLPAGSYAHSGSLEPLIKAGHITNSQQLEQFLIGRAETAGFVAAAFAAAACTCALQGDTGLLGRLEAELDARLPSPELRAVSRRLGRQLLRLMRQIHPDPLFDGLAAAPHQPIVMGVAAAAFALDPRDAALAVLHDTVSTSAAAAVRLMHTDPFQVHGMLVRMTARLDHLAMMATLHADGPAHELPAHGAPLSDIAAEHHRGRDARLFAS